MKSIKQELIACLEEFKQGRLTESRLADLIDSIADTSSGSHQDLLYVQAGGTSILSQILGYSMYVNGQPIPGPTDSQDWPYKTVADALGDGWRIISFPDMSLLMDDKATYGLGCEFILEKYGADAGQEARNEISIDPFRGSRG